MCLLIIVHVVARVIGAGVTAAGEAVTRVRRWTCDYCCQSKPASSGFTYCCACFGEVVHLKLVAFIPHGLATEATEAVGFSVRACHPVPPNASLCDRYVAELTEEFEQKLGEDRQLRLQLHEEKTELDREFTETKHQVEDDIDTEIDNLR